MRPTLVITASLISVGLFWLTEIPLGIPGEWTWERIPHISPGVDTLLGVLQAAVAGAVLLLVAWQGLRHIADASRKNIAAWLFGLTAASFLWLHAVQEAPPHPWRLSKSVFVAYYPGISGYFYKARYDVDDTSEFLKSYEDLMAEGDVLHEGTHPPGLILFHRSLISMTGSSPALVGLIETLIPDSAREAFDTIDENLQRNGRRLSAADRAATWLAVLIFQSLCAASVIPLFLLIRQTCDRRTAWQAISFWPLIPALAVFLPKSDALFTFSAAMLAYIWILAARRRSFGLGLCAGLIGWLGLFCSLAFLPIGLAVFVAAVAMKIADNPSKESMPLDRSIGSAAQAMIRPTLGGLTAVCGLTILVSVIADMDLLRVWSLNLQNHAGFYDQFPRTTWKWLLVNPIELALACGIPLALAGSVAVFRAARKCGFAQSAQTLAVAVVWAILWLSGRNSGEVARLWIPLLPLVIWISAGVWAPPKVVSPTGDSTAEAESHRWLIILITAMLVCLLTVLRISGFHFDQLGG